MLTIMKMIDARMGEPSTYAGIAAMLALLHVNVDPGIWAAVTLYGTFGAGIAAMMLSEVGSKPPMQIALDVVQALSTGLKTLSPDVAANPPASTPAAPSATPTA